MQKQYNIIKLAFNSPLHLGRGRAEYDKSFEFLHSDTLKSALFVAAIELGFDVTKSQNDIDSNPFLDSFSISSAFPYYRNELFFPRPLSLLNSQLDGFDANDAKKVKKIKWFSQAYFNALLKGETIQINKKANSHLSKNGKFFHPTLFGTKNKPVICNTESVQRVTISRKGYNEEDTDDNSSFAPFYIEQLYFEANAGLFFLFEFKDEASDTLYRPILNAAIRHLGENGLGNDRSTGNGHFMVDSSQTSITLDLLDNANTQISLSLFCPTQSDIDNIVNHSTNANYQLTRRGGYWANPASFANSTLRKKSITMFTEGSVFDAIPLTGKLVNLRPDIKKDSTHPVWRDGRPILLPIQIPTSHAIS